MRLLVMSIFCGGFPPQAPGIGLRHGTLCPGHINLFIWIRNASSRCELNLHQFELNLHRFGLNLHWFGLNLYQFGLNLHRFGLNLHRFELNLPRFGLNLHRLDFDLHWFNFCVGVERKFHLIWLNQFII